jgi:hypothetical protein
MFGFKPEVGLVIRHAYLWWNEARKGREEGAKDRPCAIVHLRQNEYQETEAFIAPITHTPPSVPEKAIEIPMATKKRLGLDHETSWVITTEVNRFVWPGPDIRTVPGGDLAYGHLPAAMTEDVILQIKTNSRERSLLVIGRDDEVLNERIRQRRKSRDENKRK